MQPREWELIDRHAFFSPVFNSVRVMHDELCEITNIPLPISIGLHFAQWKCYYFPFTPHERSGAIRNESTLNTFITWKAWGPNPIFNSRLISKFLMFILLKKNLL